VLEQGETERQVYLPEHEGGWFDFHDGRHFDGGQTITVSAPLGRLPVFARCGAMIPVTEQSGGIDPRTDTQRELIVFGAPEGESESYLYEDDGDTSDWKGEGRLELHIQLRRSETDCVLSVDGKGSFRPAFEQIVVRSVGIEGRIEVQGPSGAVTFVQGARAFSR
jgi:alpha-glucosidase